MLNDHTTSLAKASESANASTPTSAEYVEHLTVSVVTEQKEKEKRQLNVIVHKLVESAANNGPARKNGIKRCKPLFLTYWGVTVPITNAFCLGKQFDKPLLPKITLSDIQEKMAILKNSPN